MEKRTDFRRFFIWIALVPLLAAGCDFERFATRLARGSADQNGVVALEVEEMLHSSAASWNAGDLDGFLDDYWRSDDLTFSGAGGVTRGWQNVRARYLRSYWAPGATRDSLRFEDLEVTPLGPEHALALGRYVLYRPEREGEVTSTGFFSLVLLETEEGWRIVHDHTTTAPDDAEDSGI